MIGIIPKGKKTFEVIGEFNDHPEEGKIYIDPKDKRLYFYSKTSKRSNPSTGFLPIWNGEKCFTTTHSSEMYEKDVIKTDMESLSKNIDSNVADHIRYLQRRSSNSGILQPSIQDNDNMFTQVVKSIINLKKYTIVDLIDMSKLSERIIRNYYGALNKIAFMRMERWEIWINQILHLSYNITVYNGDKKVVTFQYPEKVFDSGIVTYDDIVNSKDDPLKKLVKISMLKENISKNDLKSEEVDDYTINNMMTTLTTNKPLSAQLFSRFIRMSGLSYTVEMIDKSGEVIFEYQE